MWTIDGHVIPVSSAGLTSRIRLKALKTIAHGNTTFHSPNKYYYKYPGYFTRCLQFIGSTSGHTTNAKDISAKSRTTQALGDLSDNTLQKINDRRVIRSENTGRQSKTSQFAHYGEGQKLGKQT
ncbi:hypothetical protein BDW75DRAFT_235784 [Aspergillus navahoensis]